MATPLQIQFQLLGTLTVQIAGRVVHDFRAQSVRALLAYLAVESDRAHERDHLCALLWPEASPQQAHANLRQALHRLRVALVPSTGADELILTADSTVRLNPTYQPLIDSQTHSAAVQAIRAHRHRSAAACPRCEGLLREALAAYRGEFLAGFTLSASLPFDDWLLLQRECLHDEHIFVLDTLAEYHERRGEDIEASALLRRWLALEPWREAAHLRLAAAQCRSGAVGAALRQLQRCHTALAATGASPGVELRALMQRLSTGVPAPSLPRLPTGGPPFVGRASELAALAGLLAEPCQRLITIVGTGGAGKTRLSLEAGRAAAPAFRDSVSFTPLDGLGPSDDLAAAVMEAIGLPISTARQADRELYAALADKEHLLLLDNCEHLPTCGAFVVGLLEAAPGVTVLATSRAPLMLRSEHVFALEGLTLGDPDVTPDPLSYDAGALFVAVARRAAPGFDPYSEAGSIVALCRQLEGLPLAVELAAMRTAVMPVTAIARSLAADLDALSHNTPDLPPRHHSVRAVLEWSWAFLNSDERALLASLAVFVGGFSQEAALKVCDAAPHTLERLVRHSLVRRSQQNGRYSLHALTQQFAGEMLDPGLAAAVRERFRRYFLGRLSEERAEIQVLAQDRLNIVAAWTTAIEAMDEGALLRAVEPLAQLVSGYGLVTAAELFGSAAATLSDRPGASEALAAVLTQQARLLDLNGQYERSIAAAEMLIACAQASGQPLNLAQGYLRRGTVYLHRGLFLAAWADLSAAGDMAAPIPTVEGQAVLAHSLLERAALIDTQQLPPDDRPVRAALAIFRTLGSPVDEAMASMRLGNYYRRMGHYAASLTCRREALALARAMGDRSIETRIGNDLSEDLMHLGCYHEAQAMLEKTIALAREIGFWQMACAAMEGLARACHHLGDQRRTKALIGEALELDRRYQLDLAHGYYLTTLGYAHESDGNLIAAREAYAASLDAWEYTHTEARLEPRAGLLRLALAQGDLRAALVEARHLLPALTERGLSDALEPLKVYWSCYCALAAASDPRADEILALTKGLLAQQAGRIIDEGLRHCFVMNIPAHRAITAATVGRHAAHLHRVEADKGYISTVSHRG